MKRRTRYIRKLLAVLLSMLCFSNVFNLLCTFSPSFAQIDNSSVIKGTISPEGQKSPEAALKELMQKTFTHTYTKPGQYQPVIKVRIKENPNVEYIIKGPIISVGGLLVSGIEVLEPPDEFVTREPVQTFKINSKFTLPNDINNRLKFHLVNEENKEIITELDPDSNNQTITLFEGVNTYWFEITDSTGSVQKSLARKIILDTNKPSLEIVSPSQDDLLLPRNKVVFSGIVQDENLDLVSYKINSGGEIKIDNADLEALENGKKAFSFLVDLSKLNTEIETIKVIAYDKAQNKTEETYRVVSGLSNNKFVVLIERDVINKELTQIGNLASGIIDITQGQLFTLEFSTQIYDDAKSGQSDAQAKLIINSKNFCLSFNNIECMDSSLAFSSVANFNPPVLTDSNLMVDPDDNYSPPVPLYKSIILNDPNSQGSGLEKFDVNNTASNPRWPWNEGLYEINLALLIDSKSWSDYMTAFDNLGTLTKNLSPIKIRINRAFDANISGFEPHNLVVNQGNQVNFMVSITDSNPITKENRPLVDLNAAYIKTPSEKIINNLGLICSIPEIQAFPAKEVTENCSFNFTPNELSKENNPYTLFIPVDFPSENTDTTNKIKITKDFYFFVNFETPAKIISPIPYSVIEGDNYNKLIKSELIREKLPEEIQDQSVNKIKNLAKYGLQFGSSNSIIPLKSKEGNQSIVKGITAYESTDKKIISFDYNLNFNLSTSLGFEDVFKNPFMSSGALGPLYLYTAISNLNPSDTSFNYSEPLKLLLLDKPRIQIKGSTLKNNAKTTSKVLNIKVTDNIPFSKLYPLELLIEPYDASGQLLVYEDKIKTVEKETVKVNDLPLETQEVKVTLTRSSALLNKVQEKITNVGWTDVDITSGNKYDKYKEVQKEIIKLSDSQVTRCDIEPIETSIGNTVNLSYILKSLKALKIKASGIRKSDGEKELIYKAEEIINSNYTFGKTKEGSLGFTVPNEWTRFSEVIFTIISGDESDSCRLKITNGMFFHEGNKETDSIGLSFVKDGVATILDDLVLEIMSTTFPFKDQLTLSEFKQLLKDLKLLAEDNNNGYDLETQEAAYELLKITDDLRCDLNESGELDSNLRSQVASTFQCGISTSNYQDYIANSIKQNLTTVVWLKAVVDVLKPIGAQNPPVNIGLPDSLILRAIAIPVPGLPSWISVALGLGAYIATAALNNQKTKLDYFEQVKDSTCTRVNGIIDRRFIIGKDLNNLDRMRTNTMAGISIDNSSAFKVNVTEPFPHIPQYPGFYSTCLPEGTHTITLQFNDQNTFSMSVTIPRTSVPILVEPFVGGVFRKYGLPNSIKQMKDSKRILDSGQGDIQTQINPTGAGTYLTSLSLVPNIDANTYDIADALRLYSGSFEYGNPNNKGTVESEKAKAFIDIVIDSRAFFIETSNDFPLQFVIPNSLLDFGTPGEKLNAILIDKYGIGE